MVHDIQDWAELNPGDSVTVTEPGRRSTYQATVDTKTADSCVVWILADLGVRRAFDSREGVELRLAQT